MELTTDHGYLCLIHKTFVTYSRCRIWAEQHSEIGQIPVHEGHFCAEKTPYATPH